MANRKLVWVLILFGIGLGLGNCIAQTEEPEDVIVYPNPYDPTKGFLNIKDQNNASLGTNVRLIVYDLNLTEVYSGALINDQYAGINNAGDILPPGIYFLKILVIDGATEKVRSERYRLVVK